MDKFISEEDFLAFIDSLWRDAPAYQEEYYHLLTQPGWVIARCPDHPYHATLVKGVEALHTKFSAKFPADRVSQLACEIYFRSADWWIADLKINALFNVPNPLYYYKPSSIVLPSRRDDVMWQKMCLLRTLNAYLVAYPAADLEEYCEQYIQRLVLYIQEHTAMAKDTFGNFVPFSMQHCLNLLCGLQQFTHVEDFRQRLFIQTGINAYNCTIYAQVIVSNLLKYKLLNYNIFRNFALFIPEYCLRIWSNNEQSMQAVSSFQQRLLAEVTQNLQGKNVYVLLASRILLRGSNFLVYAAHYHHMYALGEMVMDDEKQSDLKKAVLRLAQTESGSALTDDERLELIQQLRRFPAATLKAVFAIATHWRSLLCEALNWQEALPLLILTEAIANNTGSPGEMATAPTAGTSATLNGVVDLTAVRYVLAQVGEQLAQEMLLLLFYAKTVLSHAAMLLQAAGGWNRARVEQGLKHNSLIAIAAYGLLPLTRGEEGY